MGLRRIDTKRLLRAEDLPPSRDDFEVVGAFNPGAVRVGEEVVLLVRVAERPRERRPGFRGLPRWDPRTGLTVDWVPEAELVSIDARVVLRKADGLARLTFISHLRVVWCGDGRAVRAISETTFRPQSELEEFGVEDPRITEIEGQFLVTYVAVSRHGPATALARTGDFRTFERLGVIFCPENKDVVLFPERIRGRYVALHRPVCSTPFTRPELWIAGSEDLIRWGSHAPLAIADDAAQYGRVGAGSPPIRVDSGWLLLYHGNGRPDGPGGVGPYFGEAIVVDAEDPARVLRRLREPLLVPEADFEVDGFVPRVVFPTGLVRQGGSLLVFYGAADSSAGVAEYRERDLLDAMIPTTG